MVLAEISDLICHLEAYETITPCMVHAPCGPNFLNAQCMEQGKCKKRCLHSFSKEMHCDVDGYPEYRRYQTRIFIDLKMQCMVDNWWIVPYNLHLATKYHVHINVEICSSISAVKLLLSKGGWIRLAMRTTCKRSLPMVGGKTAMKLKHTLKDAMFLLPRHHGVFSPLECMMGHRLSHTLLCTSLECIRSFTMIMPVFLKLLIASKTKKQHSPNISKPILITPWPEKSSTWIFPPCLHGPMGWKNGPSDRKGVVSGAFILLVLLLVNVISYVHY